MFATHLSTTVTVFTASAARLPQVCLETRGELTKIEQRNIGKQLTKPISNSPQRQDGPCQKGFHTKGGIWPKRRAQWRTKNETTTGRCSKSNWQLQLDVSLVGLQTLSD